MTSSLSGLGNLISQPQYLPSDSRLARYAAPYYRPVIFVITSLIIFFTTIKARNAPDMVKWGFALSLLIYAAVFVWRMRMPKKVIGIFYQPRNQFLRGQTTIVVITLMIITLTACGYYDHMLWLLYTLATLLISEHNRTLAVLITLPEVAFLYILATYLGWGIHTHNWPNILAFWLANPSIGEHILGIWLVTFVFHYLVRNIHGRNKAFNQQQQWLNLVSEQWALNENPQEQRRSLIGQVAQITDGDVRLWRPRIRDNYLTDQNNEEAPFDIVTSAYQPVPTIWLPQSPPKDPRKPCLFLAEPPPRDGALAQIAIPIRRLDEPFDLLGVLDIAYLDRTPDQYHLETTCSILLKLIDHTRLILINSLQKEQARLLWDLSINLHQQLDIPRLVRQVVNDLVNVLGFDFATISLVDDNEDLIRGAGQRNAPWSEESIHPMSSEDIQSRVVREGRTYINEGKFQPYLDGIIWNKYQHYHTSRVWTSIPDPAANSPYPALGTLEAGFDHKNRKIIPHDQVHLLEQYARHVGLALANAEAHQRTRELAHAVTKLHTISRKMQRAAAHYEPHQMVQLVGQSAEQLLSADIVMLYTYDEPTQTVELVYQTQQAIEGHGELQISLQNSVLQHLLHTRSGYYANNARRDPLLVNIKENGRLMRRERTFTQRQNIKSFAGALLIDKRDNILGFLCVNYRRRHQFHPEHSQIIELFAAQASVALEETYQHRLARRMSIVRERNHLAMELHHSLSQELFGLRELASAATIYAERHEWENVTPNLCKITNIASWNLRSLQEMLDYLHECKQGQIDFINELHEYIQRTQPLHPHTYIHFDPSARVEVPKQVQFCLLRIAREGLNNALRHANCQNIHINYDAGCAGHVQLVIQDDGIGFEQAKAGKKNRHGLSSMEYYAQEISGNLRIDAQEGRGTCVKVHVSPLPNGV